MTDVNDLRLIRRALYGSIDELRDNRDKAIQLRERFDRLGVEEEVQKVNTMVHRIDLQIESAEITIERIERHIAEIEAGKRSESDLNDIDMADVMEMAEEYDGIFDGPVD